MADFKFGLVLTGGSLRGICGEIGILMAMEEYGIRPRVVIGTSAGAIVGSMYCSGMTPHEMYQAMSKMKRKDYIDFAWLDLLKILLRFGKGWTGLVKGRALLGWLGRTLRVRDLENCNPPLYIVTTNVSRGVGQVHNKGPLAALARASSAIPFFFQPELVLNEYHVDGGAVNNVALDELIDREPDMDFYVIGSVLKIQPREKNPNEFIKSPFKLLERIIDAVSHEQKKENLEAPGRDIYLMQVDPGDIGMFDIDKAPEAIMRAYEQAKELLPGYVKFTDISAALDDDEVVIGESRNSNVLADPED